MSDFLLGIDYGTGGAKTTIIDTCGNFGIIHRGQIFIDTMINSSYTTDSRNVYITAPTTTTGGHGPSISTRWSRTKRTTKHI